MNLEMRPVARFITEQMLGSAYSIEELTLLCGAADPQQVSDIIGGRRKLPLRMVAAMAAALNCSETQWLSIALRDWFGDDLFKQIERCFLPEAINNAEAAWLQAVRNLHKGSVPELTPNRRRRLRLLAEFSA